MEGIPLVYSGKADDDDAPYKKCLMLHPGDKIQVQITQHCNKASRINRLWSKVYKWVSGPTKGELL
jgi:hypothetical protein